jgi:DNA uptake protein ComE-like DNA-binding protein
MRIKHRLIYPIRERLTCSEREAVALIVIFLAVFTGGVMRVVKAAHPPFDDNSYVELDSFFSTLSARLDSSDNSAVVHPADTIHIGFRADFDHVSIRASGIEEWALVDTLEKPKASFPIAINEANEKTLQALPRIGPAMARRILEHRRLKGPLASSKDLLEIRGIGPKTVEKLLPLIVFDLSRESTQEDITRDSLHER